MDGIYSSSSSDIYAVFRFTVYFSPFNCKQNLKKILVASKVGLPFIFKDTFENNNNYNWLIFKEHGYISGGSNTPNIVGGSITTHEW